MSVWPQWYENKLFTVLVSTLLFVLIIFTGTAFAKTVREMNQPNPEARTVTVEGNASTSIAPDIATVWLGITTTADTVAEAQEENTESVNTLLTALKDAGVPEDDTQTQNYSVYEDERWNPETQQYDSEGWNVSQTVEITLRDTSMVSTVLAIGGSQNVTSISGPNFAVEDANVYTAEARAEAIEKAKVHAQAIADALGMNLVEVVDYSEQVSSGGDQPRYMYAEDSLQGSEPDIATGTEKVTVNVQVTYELR